MAEDDNTTERGLGSDKMSAEEKHRIQSAGGKNLSREDRAKGGKNSRGGRSSESE